MNIRLYDAHLHLQDSRLKAMEGRPPRRPPLDSQDDTEVVPPLGLQDDTEVVPPSSLVPPIQLTNGTHPDDWEEVAGLEGEHILRAYGAHPWKVDSLPDDWEEQLRHYLASGAVSVGEIGLDRWIEPRDENLQRDIFERQLLIAAELHLPPSIHCVRAWGMLVDCLRGNLPPMGFLVHGFGGSKEVLYQLLDLGGYVSFSAYAAHPSKHRIREAIRACPMDRLLVETDAPGMAPPEDICQYPLSDTKGRMHHPWEIRTAYAYLAELKKMELEDFAEQVEENFGRLFF